MEKGANILITGATGFIGGFIVDKALAEGMNVWVAVRPSSSRKYLTADGNIAEGSVICIREVQVGDVTLKNIEASVVKNQKAPLLLGQSVLERFGSFTLDNYNSKLIIKHKQ